MLTEQIGITTRRMVQIADIRAGLSMFPYEPFWFSEIGVAVPTVDAELVLKEEPFLNIAASGEFGDRPRSSACAHSNQINFFHFNYVLILQVSSKV